MARKGKCPLCDLENVDIYYIDTVRQGEEPIDHYNCPRCGRYEIGDLLSHMMQKGEYRDEKYVLSALSRIAWEREEERREREHDSHFTPFRINPKTINEQLASIVIPKNPLDRIDRLLLLVEKRTTYLKVGADIDIDNDYPLIFSRNAEEFQYLLKIAQDIGLLESTRNADQTMKRPFHIC